MRIVWRVVISLALIYALLVAGLSFAMHQPPEKFGAIMAKLPPFAYIVLPFESLWMRARAGHLQIGDPAPDFSLKTADRTEEVRLSTFRGVKPAILVFGSYT